MAEIILLTSTGNRQIDDILRGVIGVFEAAFPGRTRPTISSEAMRMAPLCLRVT